MEKYYKSAKRITIRAMADNAKTGLFWKDLRKGTRNISGERGTYLSCSSRIGGGPFQNDHGTRLPTEASNEDNRFSRLAALQEW